ncbi:MAG: hypothetical protein AAF787_06055 [Chloroflexota bacterium]
MRMIPVMLLVILLVSACGGSVQNEPISQTTSVNPLCTEEVLGAPSMPLTLENTEQLGDDCYSATAGETFVVSYDEPGDDFATVQFFLSCPEVDSENPDCLTQAEDADGSDGFQTEFTTPAEYELMRVAAFAYDSDGAPLTGAGPVIVVVEQP